MISGNNVLTCFKDMSYNMEPEDYAKIIATKKSLKSELSKIKNSEYCYTDENLVKTTALTQMIRNFDNVIVPSIYNQLSGYDNQTSFYKDSAGNPNEANKEISRLVDLVASSAKYEEGSILQRTVNSLYNQFYSSETTPPSPEEIEQEVRAQSARTKNEEDVESDPDRENNDNPLTGMPGYCQLEDWLKKLQGSTTKKKKYKQMTKMSDLQKVSVVNFIQPKALFMKKIVNKEMYLKKTADSERYMHIMSDNSGSMGDYFEWRNQLLKKTYEDCTKMNINVETGYWNSHLHKDGKLGPQRIRTKQQLQDLALSIMPDGSDQMGTCVCEKLASLQKKKEKQYILCISDGTGSINDREQSRVISELARSKNIEIKFALFSRNNDMYDTDKNDIFYIYE